MPYMLFIGMEGRKINESVRESETEEKLIGGARRKTTHVPGSVEGILNTCFSEAYTYSAKHPYSAKRGATEALERLTGRSKGAERSRGTGTRTEHDYGLSDFELVL